MANVLTKKQMKALKVLTQSGSVNQTQSNRFVFENLVDIGLAFKNAGTRHHPTKTGKVRYVPSVVYAPTPEAFRLATDLDVIDVGAILKGRNAPKAKMKGKRQSKVITAQAELR